MAIVTLVLDPLLALATFAVVPLLFAVTVYYGRRVKSLARRQRKQEGQIASLAAETLAAMQVVKAFGSEDYESDRVATRSAERQDLGIEAAKAEARFSGLVEIIGAVARALVLVLGVLRVAAGAISPGDLIVFVTYANKTYRPLRDIARQATKSSRALARADRVADVLAADHVLEERSGSFAAGRAAGDVALDRVQLPLLAGPAGAHGPVAAGPGRLAGGPGRAVRRRQVDRRRPGGAAVRPGGGQRPDRRARRPGVLAPVAARPGRLPAPGDDAVRRQRRREHRVRRRAAPRGRR